MEKNLSDIKKRILLLAETLEDTKQKFFKNCDVSYNNFKGSALKSSLSTDLLGKIFSSYGQINLEWVLTGKGEKINNHNTKSEVNETSCLNKEADTNTTIQLLEKLYKEERERNEKLVRENEYLRRKKTTYDIAAER